MKPQLKCEACDRDADKIHYHHVVPKACGGVHGEKKGCCATCNKQVHLLFSEKELSKMTFEELLETEEMKKYITWIRKRTGNFKGRLSTRVKRKGRR